MFDYTKGKYQRNSLSWLVGAILAFLETCRDMGSSFYVITETHDEKSIHSGVYYYISSFITLDLGDTFYVKLVTPDSAKRLHFQWEIVASGILETNFYEGASGGMTGGADVTPINSDRNSTNTSDVIITAGVTVATTKGTKIDSVKVGGEGFKTVVGGSASRSDEILLKQNTTYFREYISGSDDNIITFRAKWIEI